MTPEEAPSTPEPTEGGGDEFDFGGFVEPSADEFEPPEETPAEAPPAESPAAAQTQPSEEGTQQPPVEKQPPQTQEAPAAQPAAQPQEQPQAPSPQQSAQDAQTAQVQPVDESDPASILQALQANPEGMVTYLAENMFKLRQEDVDELNSSPETFLPKAAGRIMVQAMQSSLHQIKNIVPKLVDAQVKQFSETQATRSAAEQAFRAAWPQIKPSRETNALIKQFADAKRAADPNISQQDLIQFVGRAVLAMQGQAGAAPAQQPNGGRPFTPAPAGVEIEQQAIESPWDGFLNVSEDFGE